MTGEVRSFWPIGWAILNYMKFNEKKKKINPVIAAFEDLGPTIKRVPQDSQSCDHGM